MDTLPTPACATTSERFLLAGGNFRAIVASESHWLQLVLVSTVHWWPILVSVVGLTENRR